MNPLLLDMGLPQRSAGDLRNHGWDVVHVAEEGLARATDIAILEFAADTGRTVVTLDRDFTLLLATHGYSTPSVIYVRIEHMDRMATTELLKHIVPSFKDEIETGAVVTVEQGRARVRYLPIQRNRSDGARLGDCPQ